MKVENWNGHNIRFVEHEGEWWAVAKDVADALGYRDANTALRKMSDKYKGTLKVRTLGGEQTMLGLNEKGMYRLIMRSNKPEAEEFQDWVYETLKNLREASGYEGFQIWRFVDDIPHQKQQMSRLHTEMKEPSVKDKIKSNTIANKATSTKHGYQKMMKKGQMTPEMLVDRQPILQDTVELMVVSEKYDLDIKVADEIYKRHCRS